MATPGLLPIPEDLSIATPSTARPLSLLVSDEDLGLTAEETQELAFYQTALTILGPAAGSVLMCPGNQLNVADEDRCPYSSKCPLLRMGKAPENRMCPIERKLVEDRFNSWCRELGTEALTILESDRVAVSDLTWIDLKEQRCLHILSKGEEARLTVTNPKDVHPETLLPISWEKVIHPNMELLVVLQTQRRLILKDWMLTPEQKWKKAKAEGKGTGKDLSSLQSANADKLRSIGSGAQD
jgi:hypothetical protein